MSDNQRNRIKEFIYNYVSCGRGIIVLLTNGTILTKAPLNVVSNGLKRSFSYYVSRKWFIERMKEQYGEFYLIKYKKNLKNNTVEFSYNLIS